MRRALLPDILAAAVAARPGRDSRWSFEGRAVTYRELDEQSHRLARMLIEQGAGPETVVAVAMPRSARVGARGVGGGQDRRRLRAGGPELSGGADRAHARPIPVRPRGAPSPVRDESLPDAVPYLVLDDADTAAGLDRHSPRRRSPTPTGSPR